MPGEGRVQRWGARGPQGKPGPPVPQAQGPVPGGAPAPRRPKCTVPQAWCRHHGDSVGSALLGKFQVDSVTGRAEPGEAARTTG